MRFKKQITNSDSKILNNNHLSYIQKIFLNVSVVRRRHQKVPFIISLFQSTGCTQWCHRCATEYQTEGRPLEVATTPGQLCLSVCFQHASAEPKQHTHTHTLAGKKHTSRTGMMVCPHPYPYGLTSTQTTGNMVRKISQGLSPPPPAGSRNRARFC